MGPAFRLASQIMISFTLFPVGVLAVKRSYATFPTTLPEVVCDQLHVDYNEDSNSSNPYRLDDIVVHTGILLIAESCLPAFWFCWMFE